MWKGKTISFVTTTCVLLALFCASSVSGFANPTPPRQTLTVPSIGINCGGRAARLRTHSDHGGAVEKTENPSHSGSIVDKTRYFLKETFGDSQKFVKASTSGLVVSLAMVPEAVAFAFVAGVNPLVGLWTTVVLGFVAAALGGRAGICSSASGACSVVVASLCASHGPAYLSACAVLAGALQIGGGLLNVGKFIRLVPHPVMLGFVNGLAIVMTNAQLVHFKNPSGQFMSLTSKLGASTYGIAALTMALVKLLPKVTKAVPPTLGAVAISSIVAKLFSIPAKTLADVAGASTFAGGLSVLPKFGLPSVPFSLETLQVILPYAITMAAVGSIESLLTMQLVDSLVDDGKRGSAKQECIGQGSGNVLSGLTGGIGGCALLGQSVINVQSGGGISRWSGMSMSLFLAMGIVIGAPLLASVPIAALVGVMLLVCQSTFSWSSLRLMRKIPRIDAAVIALVTAVTVKHDLASAVVSGTILSALNLAWNQSTKISASGAENKTGEKIYTVDGPLYFGSTTKFLSLFPVKSDCADGLKSVTLDFSKSNVVDHSAVEAIANLAVQYNEAGVNLNVRGLSSESEAMLKKLYSDPSDAPFAFQLLESAQMALPQ